jgi:hypothetical protein
MMAIGWLMTKPKRGRWWGWGCPDDAATKRIKAAGPGQPKPVLEGHGTRKLDSLESAAFDAPPEPPPVRGVETGRERLPSDDEIRACGVDEKSTIAKTLAISI